MWLGPEINFIHGPPVKLCSGLTNKNEIHVYEYTNKLGTEWIPLMPAVIQRTDSCTSAV